MEPIRTSPSSTVSRSAVSRSTRTESASSLLVPSTTSSRALLPSASRYVPFSCLPLSASKFSRWLLTFVPVVCVEPQHCTRLRRARRYPAQLGGFPYPSLFLSFRDVHLDASDQSKAKQNSLIHLVWCSAIKSFSINLVYVWWVDGQVGLRPWKERMRLNELAEELTAKIMQRSGIQRRVSGSRQSIWVA